MKRIIILCTVLSCVLSCSPQKSEIEQDTSPGRKSKSWVSDIRTIPDDSLQYYVYRIEKGDNDQQLANFSTPSELPRSWVGLSKNAIGLFAYRCGKGYAHTLTIAHDTIRNGGYGEPVSWRIRELREIKDYTYHFGLGLDTLSSSYARCAFEILDTDTLYAIQTTQVLIQDSTGHEKLLGQYSGLYIPRAHVYMFRHIDEPNTQNPNSWIPTEEIDVQEFKRRKLAAASSAPPSQSWTADSAVKPPKIIENP